MDENAWLAERCEEYRGHLRAVAYRMLGALTEADEAVQDTRLRLSQSGAGAVANLGGCLTTSVARVCLNLLRSRHVRREYSFGLYLPDPIISPDGQPSHSLDALLWTRFAGGVRRATLRDLALTVRPAYCYSRATMVL
jgi:DNA-directed RNA polymerase specialized sigma24 family protein